MRLRSPLAVLAALVAVAAWTAPAAAHDQLVESDPPADAVTAAPTAITLTFNADILDLSSQVVVTDAAGQVVLDAPGEADGAVLTVPVEQSFDAGVHLVTWRVVSSDGHPIEGTFSFTVVPAETPAPDPETAKPTTQAPEPPATEPPVATPDATAAPTPPPAEAAGEGVPGVVLVGVPIVLAVAAGWLLLRRRH